MNAEKLSPPEQICKFMSRIYEAKLTTVSGGNLSLKDLNGNIWVTPSGGDKGRYHSEDILKISPEGKVEGSKKPSVETGIHRSILADRPEFKAVVHAHPPGLVAVSLLRELPETMLIPQTANSVKNMKLAAYGCPGSEELKENVAKEFRDNPNTNVAILENHGAFVASEKSLMHAFGVFRDLDFSTRIQAKAQSFWGRPPKLISQEQLEYYNRSAVSELGVFKQETVSDREMELRKDICDFCDRAYRRDLFTQNIGVISARLDEDSFLITGSGADNAELTVSEVVKIQRDLVEEGKKPSRSVMLHKKIYEDNPEINAVIMAAPENAMIFAVTDLEYDLKTIPECYIVLREKISKFPFGSTIDRQEELAQYFRTRSPVAIVENDCYICTGTNIFNAFDKLEVIEFSAEAVFNGKLLGGPIKSITEKQVQEIKTQFGI
ncbi:class II aldolase/adducin family protein [Aminipila sp.]|jgi:L-fuculose-phosphate aldolase|uniref:class II aldolase/adducin family protein n=1 Tax=Aminipila sp. TaxID=2060095 RepID=UPI001D1BE249|nr:class II aldolase/adducin family protein [Aminipila sp.]MBE6034323.1 class II aldolase/adducin family protein [Clostridiales bacterium]